MVENKKMGVRFFPTLKIPLAKLSQGYLVFQTLPLGTSCTRLPIVEANLHIQSNIQAALELGQGLTKN
jgi:hypothetical protein